ncbi:MAG: flagellar hook-associated protein FlgK [Planctomycetes bacterium]|nr:flagellar hook-associated protein FlgK [Planctomycetota bacterium]
MSLTGALHVGRTGLAVSQAALEVTGNNLANAATAGYSRQSAVVAAGPSQEVAPGSFIGTGARLQSIIRQTDEALKNRLRAAVSDQQAAQTQQDLLSQIESIEGELTDQGLSTRLGDFLNSWSELASSPSDSGIKSLVISNGGSIASYLQDVRSELTNLRDQIDHSLNSNVKVANGLLDKIADLNQKIALSEKGLGTDNALRDQRDQVLSDLSQYLDVTTIEQPNGALNVFVNSTPVVLGNVNRGLSLDVKSDDDQLTIQLRVTADGTPLNPGGGSLGQLIKSRQDDVLNAVDVVDNFAQNLIFELNKLHASGQGSTKLTSVTSSNYVLDPTAALNSAAADLPFSPVNGSFQIHVTQKNTGATTTVQIPVDLDGIGTDTSLNDIATALNAVGNITATVNPNGSLSINSSTSDFEFSFSDDSSGLLAAMGINTFFTGTSAADINVNAALKNQPNLLAVGQNNVAGDNGTALAIAKLGDQPIASENGQSLRDLWRQHVEDYAIRTAKAGDDVDSTTLINESLTNQLQSVTGVNVDEESINLLQFQRAFQGSARFISVVDQMMQTLLELV